MRIEQRGLALWSVCLALFIAGILNESPWKGYTTNRQLDIGSEPERIALNLADRDAFADPFAPRETGPTAHSAPAFPFLLSLLLRIFGKGSHFWLVLRLLPTIALSAQFALLPALARSLGFNAWAGVLASIFGIITKPGREEMWEAHISGLLILLLTAAACSWQLRPRNMSVPAGALAGITLFFQPVIFPVYLAWLIYETHRCHPWFNRTFLPLWLLPLVICAPWVVRNYIRLNAPLAIRDDLGLELYVSYNDCAPYGFQESLDAGCVQRFHPNANPVETAAVSELGEYAYNKHRLNKALTWIFHAPVRSLKLAGERLWYFWFPSESGWPGYRHQGRRILLHFLTALSILGGVLSVKRRIPSAVFLVFWLVLFPPVYYLIQFDPRYRYPILWITWLLAAYCIFEGIAWVKSGSRQPQATRAIDDVLNTSLTSSA